ncbi:MAG: oxygen-independent coproporphyrinogen III oxidase [Cyanobacteria bacterium HKST-UBA06]|nr:oxygen-independent coproporphyrinogen III oxidase [Cyanobacteria bacterium HKST-UBA06]
MPTSVSSAPTTPRFEKAALHVPEALLQRYNTSGPRYTSYPTVPDWTDTFGPHAFTQALKQFQAQQNEANAAEPDQSTPLSLYTHIPFCTERCLFCGCNVVITRQTEQAEKYLDFLSREIDMLASHTPDTHAVVQYHWGGGTPTYLTPDQMRRLFGQHKRLYNFADDAEISIEVDPRVTTDEHLETLRHLGFNRVSMGVQDFNDTTQQAVKRVQSLEQTAHLTQYSRALGFSSVNMDLIYGLPHQTRTTFEATLDHIIALDPDRIALYNFAYVPWISPHQKKIDPAALPDGTTKFEIFSMAIDRLTSAGYTYMGMDHFAKPDDELTRAFVDGTLYRNFMGYTTKAGSQMVSAGVSAISGLEHAYAQNHRKLSQYYEAIQAGHLATMRGLAVSDTDRLHRDIIQAILCQGRLTYSQISQTYGIDFNTQFAPALARLAPMAEDGLVELHNDHLQLLPLGRVFSRNVAMCFDPYLAQRQEDHQADGNPPAFSKTL